MWGCQVHGTRSGAGDVAEAWEQYIPCTVHRVKVMRSVMFVLTGADQICNHACTLPVAHYI